MFSSSSVEESCFAALPKVSFLGSSIRNFSFWVQVSETFAVMSYYCGQTSLETSSFPQDRSERVLSSFSEISLVGKYREFVEYVTIKSKLDFLQNIRFHKTFSSEEYNLLFCIVQSSSAVLVSSDSVGINFVSSKNFRMKHNSGKSATRFSVLLFPRVTQIFSATSGSRSDLRRLLRKLFWKTFSGEL